MYKQIEETDEYLLAEALDSIHREISGYTQLDEVNMINVHLVADYFIKHTDFAPMLYEELKAQLNIKEDMNA